MRQAITFLSEIHVYREPKVKCLEPFCSCIEHLQGISLIDVNVTFLEAQKMNSQHRY